MTQCHICRRLTSPEEVCGRKRKVKVTRRFPEDWTVSLLFSQIGNFFYVMICCPGKTEYIRNLLHDSASITIPLRTSATAPRNYFSSVHDKGPSFLSSMPVSYLFVLANCMTRFCVCVWHKCSALTWPRCVCMKAEWNEKKMLKTAFPCQRSMLSVSIFTKKKTYFLR